jgi:5-methylcytosine-specific restriction endonuclease McrA
LAEDTREELRRKGLEQWRNPVLREVESCRATEQWDSAARKEQSKRLLQYCIEHPEKGKAHSEWMRRRFDENPGMRKQMSRSLVKFHREHPEVAEEHGKRMKRLHRSGLYDSVVERLLEYWSDPENCEVMSKKMTEHWSDSDVRRVQSERKLAYWDSTVGEYRLTPYGVEWTSRLRRRIRRRDGLVCVLCGRSEEELGRKLCVHHIDYDKKNGDPENLLSLCVSCHIKTNYNREYWVQLFQEMMLDASVVDG